MTGVQTCALPISYVSYLRRKLDPLGPPLIHTQRGVGYSLRPPERGQAGPG